MANAGGKKVRLSIVPCKTNNSGGPWQVESGPTFEVQLNPSAYKHAQAIEYNTETAPGRAGQDARFNAVGADKVGFNFLIDGTGVVQPNANVTDRLDALRKVVFTYQGKKHQPNVVRVLWGTFVFYGRLESINVDYTLFKPSGEPLRAKVDLSFVGTMGQKEEALMANRSSPDLTHVVAVCAGDTLPLLCERIYGDSGYYPAVARYNRIVNFRALRPGQRIVFPAVR